MKKYFCKNNHNHGQLRPSEWNTPRSTFKTFVCDICKTSWDEEKDLKEAIPSLNSTNNYPPSLLRDLNNNLKEKVDFHLRTAIPFSFQLREENNSICLKVFDIIDGSRVKKDKVHTFTKNIVERIVSEIEKKYSVTISWMS